MPGHVSCSASGSEYSSPACMLTKKQMVQAAVAVQPRPFASVFGCQLGSGGVLCTCCSRGEGAGTVKPQSKQAGFTGGCQTCHCPSFRNFTSARSGLRTCRLIHPSEYTRLQTKTALLRRIGLWKATHLLPGLSADVGTQQDVSQGIQVRSC